MRKKAQHSPGVSDFPAHVIRIRTRVYISPEHNIITKFESRAQ